MYYFLSYFTACSYMMAKLDLRDAYRMVPVHPVDRPLLGMRWKGSVFIDCALPFGLRSAPKIFSALADALIWIVHTKGFPLSMHYLDDFLLLDPPNSQTCAAALVTTQQLCKELGVSVAEEKTEGPTTTLTFLGIELDSVKMQLRLPQVKLQNLTSQINYWMQNRSSSGDSPKPHHTGSKRDLLSLMGLLNHACSVVRPGRTFLHSLIDASTTVKHLDHHVTLRAKAKADIVWWHLFLQSWNGISILPEADPSHFVYSDASGSWGCGGYWKGQWFQIQWPNNWLQMHIAPKEFIPILIAVASWGREWHGKRVCCYCDNSAVVFAVNKGSAKDPRIMHLLRSLALYCAFYNVTVTARHIAGTQNNAADALLRNNLKLFHSLIPQAHQQGLSLSPSLLELAFNSSLPWTSPDWIKLFTTTLKSELLHQPTQYTNQPSTATQHSAN